MTQKTNDQWYYIVIQNPGTPSEEFLGYEDQTSGATFIPVFLSKEEASQCFLVMPKDIMNQKYEVQAIIKEDLMLHAVKSGYKIFLMNDKGIVQEEIN